MTCLILVLSVLYGSSFISILFSSSSFTATSKLAYRPQTWQMGYYKWEHYQTKGLYGYVIWRKKDFMVGRPYPGSPFWAQDSVPNETAAVASEPKELWNLRRRRGSSISIASSRQNRGYEAWRLQQCQEEMIGRSKTSLKRLILEPWTAQKYRKGKENSSLAQHGNCLRESESVKTNMKIIDIASLLDNYDWCFRYDCENVWVAMWLAVSYFPVSNDAVVSAETVLSGGLQPLHVLKAFNPRAMQAN